MSSQQDIRKYADDVEVGFSDFLTYFGVTDPDEWMVVLRVSPDGVWVNRVGSNTLLTPEQIAVLMNCPSGNPSLPVLTWPCTIGQIREVVNFYGNGNVVIDPFDLAGFAARAKRSAPGNPGCSDDRPLDPRERTTFQRIIRALIKMANLPDRGAAASVVMQLQAMGFTGPAENTIRTALDQARGLEPDGKPQ